jgi:hypothetical protein
MKVDFLGIGPSSENPINAFTKNLHWIVKFNTNGMLMKNRVEVSHMHCQREDQAKERRGYSNSSQYLSALTGQSAVSTNDFFTRVFHFIHEYYTAVRSMGFKRKPP